MFKNLDITNIDSPTYDTTTQHNTLESTICGNIPAQFPSRMCDSSLDNDQLFNKLPPKEQQISQISLNNPTKPPVKFNLVNPDNNHMLTNFSQNQATITAQQNNTLSYYYILNQLAERDPVPWDSIFSSTNPATTQDMNSFTGVFNAFITYGETHSSLDQLPW